MGYDKPWKDYRAQLAQLQARGMAVDDPERAIDCLRRIGYYRLSGYWFAFRERSGRLVLLDESGRKPKKIKEETLALDSFRPGTRFHDVADLYVFDKRLRMLVLDAVERIEIAMRVEVSHTLGQLDAFAHLRPELLHEDFAAKMHSDVCLTKHHQWCTKQAQLIGRSREEFVKHNKAKYGLPLAIWVACEVWDFGTMSTLYNGMRVTEQDEIARRFGVSDGRVRHLASRPELFAQRLRPPQPPVESQRHRPAKAAATSGSGLGGLIRREPPPACTVLLAAMPVSACVACGEPALRLA